MLDDGKISSRQFMLLVIFFTIGNSTLFIPTILATLTKQDAWITSILGLGVGALLVLLYNKTGKYFPNMTVVQYSEQILGKWFGKIVSFLFCSFTFMLSGLVIRNIADFVSTFLITNTPIELIQIIFLSIVIMGARLGIETVARTAEILFVFLIVLYLVAILGLLPKGDLTKLQPVFEGGVKPIIRGLITYSGSPFFELVVFLMIFPSIDKLNKVKKTFLIGTLVGGISLTISLFYCLIVFGPNVTAENIFVSFTLIRDINIAGVLQRIEAIIAVVGLITAFFKATICFYASALSFAQMLNTKDFRFLTFPMGVILIVFSTVAFPNESYATIFITKIWATYAGTIGLLLPLLLLGVAVIRKKC